jgi:hypothetical protein
MHQLIAPYLKMPTPNESIRTWHELTKRTTSRAFRKSMTSRLARSAAANQHNHGGLVVRESQINLVRIYEMLY